MAINTSNYPQNVPIVQRIPTRIVASDTLTLNAATSVTIPGTNNRQDRVQIVITNLDAGQNLKIQTVNGKNLGTVFPQTVETFDTSADLVLNNTGANSMQIEVCEFYPDTGIATAIQSAPGAPGNARAGGSGAVVSGGGGGGAGSGGLSGGSGTGSRTQLR